MIFDKNDVFPGSILRNEIDGKFDGVFRLIEPAGDEMSEMEHDRSPVVVKRRWLVEFVGEEGLSGGERFTQANQKGKRTHRTIRFVAGKFRNLHKKYQYIHPTSSNNDFMLDEFDGCF